MPPAERVGVVGLPFLFENLPQAWAVLDGPVGESLAEAAEAKGLVLLALWDMRWSSAPASRC